jgi:molybdopterin molybdotransferase
MPEFLNLIPLETALARLLEELGEAPAFRTETLPVDQALDRFLAQEIRAPSPLPPFNRSTVDGYAVRARDTFGANPSLPAYLRITDEVRMGTAPGRVLNPGETAIIHTGGMMPEGADAVVMLEDAQPSSAAEVEVLRPAAVGENVLMTGEDVEKDEIVLTTGARLRPQEIGGLLALGIARVGVLAKPRVGVISTGDELVHPDSDPGEAQIRDINSFTLAALVDRHQGEPILHGIVADDFDRVAGAVQKSHAEDDIVIVTAGSSVSARDITSAAIETLGLPGVLAHGISIKPGKPTILALAGGKPVIGLPGNPVSAFVIAGLLLPPILRRLLGVDMETATATVKAKLTTNIPSAAGREDYIPVKLTKRNENWFADPVHGRSNLIFTLVRSDGLIRIPPHATGLAAETTVEVIPI